MRVSGRNESERRMTQETARSGSDQNMEAVARTTVICCETAVRTSSGLIADGTKGRARDFD